MLPDSQSKISLSTIPTSRAHHHHLLKICSLRSSPSTSMVAAESLCCHSVVCIVSVVVVIQLTVTFNGAIVSSIAVVVVTAITTDVPSLVSSLAVQRCN